MGWGWDHGRIPLASHAYLARISVLSHANLARISTDARPITALDLAATRRKRPGATGVRPGLASEL
jgi:hypothetical protein